LEPFFQLALGPGGYYRRQIEEATRMQPIDHISYERLPEPVQAPQEEVDLLDLLLVLARRKRVIFLSTLAGFVIAAAAMLLIRPNFTAKALIMPPQQQESSASALLGQFSALASVTGMGGSLGMKNPSDLYVGILQSESVADDLITRFDLMRIYRSRKLSLARRKLQDNSKFVSEKDGLISISVVDHDPKRAATLANAYVDELYQLNNRLAITEASQRRLFFEQQLAREKDNLADAEVALKQTEESTGLITPAGQTDVTIRQIAQLQAEITLHEIELQSLSTSATGENPEVIRLNTELGGLRGQLLDLEDGSKKHSPGDVSITTANVPTVGLEYVRKERDVQYHQLLFDMIARQYEFARLDEARAAPIIQRVDHAQVPDRKSGPARALWTLLGGILGFLVSCVWVFVAHLLFRMEADVSQGPRLAALRQELRLRG
jgi:tyrosine-protein kinase Etk/Wzc